MDGKAHILLVDDQDGTRYSLSKMLENSGYRVTAAEDYRKALDVLDSDEPCDLLITDIIMPDRVNGFALARMARMRRPKLKVISITGYDVPTNEADGMVFRRPLRDDEFLKEVESALSG